MPAGKRPTGRNMGDLDRETDATWEARAERKRAGKPRVPDLPLLSCGGCWCGERFGHSWPGKAEGAPHPRDWPGRVNGHGYRDGTSGEVTNP